MKHKRALYLLAPISINMFTIGVYVCRNLGIIAESFFTRNSIQLGASFQSVLIAFAVALVIKESYIEKESARKAEETKNLLLSQVSHEMRTPLNSIIGVADLLQETELDEKQQEYISVFDRATKSLLALINDILDFSKYTSGKAFLNAINFDLIEFITRSADRYRLNAKRQGLDFHLHIDPEIDRFVYADRERIGQVLNNLVANAIKFTDEGSITLRLSQKGDYLFQVIDTGIGIEPENLEKVFQLFTQAELSTTRKFGGTGLGLAICRAIVRQMGGTISAESSAQRGSTFQFSLPLPAGKRTLTNKKLPSKKSDLSKVNRILLVEDNADNVILFQHYFDSTKIALDVAENGLIGVEMAEKQAYDIILMDIEMPELDGYEATKAIRKSEGPNKNTPVLVLSAYASQSERSKSLEAGANDYLSKPVKKQVLFEAILQQVKN